MRGRLRGPVRSRRGCDDQIATVVSGIAPPWDVIAPVVLSEPGVPPEAEMDRPLLLTVGMHCLEFRRIALPILVGVLVAQAGGCKTSSLEKTDAGDGHAAPDSAIDRTDSRDAAPDSAIDRTDSRDAAPDSAIDRTDSGDAAPDSAIDRTDSGDAGPDSGVVTCATDPAAPVSSSGTPRRTMPWLFVASTRDGAAATDGGPGGGDAGASGCTTGAAAMSGTPFGNLSNVTCAGSATARVSGGNIDLVFADGAVLRWDTTGVANPVAPPALPDGATASIDYHRTWMIVCPVCGAYYTATMQIRTGSDQKLIWVAREGTEISDVDADLVSELFGVTFSEKLNCRIDDQRHL